MKSPAFRQAMREYELNQALPWLPPGCSVLEIGAGAGWQARMLAERGFRVEAVDIATSRYRESQVWPVHEYDGEQIPFPDGRFDLIFSSNTLEHIPHIVPFMAEMRRVLRPGGRAVHILPSTAWRFWTLATHFPFIPHDVKKAWLGRRAGGGSLGAGLLKALIPSRHGGRGSALSELRLFSRAAWISLFERTGWQVQACLPNRLFYTGHGLFGDRLGLKVRRTMSYGLGSACNIYVLEPGV